MPDVPEHLRERPDLRFLTREQLCERCGLSERLLTELARRGTGPRYLRLGRRTLYHTASVLEWEEEQLRASTARR